MRTSLTIASILAGAAAEAAHANPVPRVIALIEKLKARIEADGQAEQAVYDKFACWCEDTTARKASAIETAKNDIERLSQAIVQNKGKRATLTAELKQLAKDIASNEAAQAEATAIRSKENESYSAERQESEQCVMGLEHAIRVLAGAGTGKKSALQETQLLSVAAGVRMAMARLSKEGPVDSEKLALVRQFLSHPNGEEAYVQLGNNPFGDYAPQSTQIQGILKDMYDTFVSDQEKNNGEEASKNKAFQELMETKKLEHRTLTATQAAKEEENGNVAKQLADDKQQRDETAAQLKEDEAFFAQTKEQCAFKADEWAERSRLRTEELAGVGRAIKILSEGAATFESATSFVEMEARVQSAYDALKAAARETHDIRVAALAVNVKMGGHFDEVMNTIDKMIAALREEEQMDVEHRDWCVEQENQKQNQEADMAHTIETTQALIDRLDAKSTELQGAIDKVAGEITEQENAMKAALDVRNEEQAAFKAALKDDEDAVALLGKAIESMAAFYANNKLSMGLVQQPEHTVDKDKAPETWSKPYGGRSSESKGLVSILEMIKEDLEKEMSTSKKEEKETQAEYMKGRKLATDALEAMNTKKTSLEQQKAETDAKAEDARGDRDTTETEKAEKQAELKALQPNCDWVKNTFDSRRTKRHAEIDGLQTAKSYLGGSRPAGFLQRK